MSPPFKYLIIGPPGTGKTSTAIRILEHLIGQKDHGEHLSKLGINLPYAQYNLDDLAFVSFQTSVIKEFAERTGLTLDYHEGSETEFFGTFHAIAYRMARDHGLITNHNKQYSPEEQFKYFLDQNGLRNQFDLSFAGFSNPSLKGNRIWLALTKAIGVYYPKLRRGAYLKAKQMLEPELRKYIPLWIRWKKGQNPWEVELIDYNDMLISAYEGLKRGEIKPKFKVMLVDEAQDLNPLMWAILDLLKPYLEGLILLGDPDQAIFGFSGADPKLLEEWDDREKDVIRVVLPQSYRLPKRIKALAIRIIERTKNRKAKEFRPRDFEGFYHHGFLDVREPRDVENFLKIIKKEAERIAQERKYDDKIDILILARTNALALKLARILLRAQVKFEHLKSESHSIWEMGDKKIGTLGDFIDVLRKVKSGERLSFADYVVLLGYSKIAKNEEEFDRSIEALRSGNFPLDLWDLKRNPFSILDKAKILQAIYPGVGRREVSKWVNSPPALAREFFSLIEDIITGRDKPLNLPEGIRIAVDTLHASKGREGRTVIIWNQLTNKKWLSHYITTREDFDNELRAWYVGVTRALERLYILDGPFPFLETI
ncbi:ATP-dependent helicase [Thermococci archaeon]|nr:MAG: ATP-dependent helicase [Chloroflexota bacterium]RLF90150.1 MAG: ATP-dependent helicase [Thermococci archaeon]